MKTSDIDYRDGALTCRGFLAYDETKSGRRPGVLLVHEALDRKSTRLNSSHRSLSRMPSSA